MRTVIFDLDGTLADTSGDLIAAANACFEHAGHGVQLDPAKDQATALRGGRAMLALGCERLKLDGYQARALISNEYEHFLGYYEEKLDIHTKLYPGVEEALSALDAAGYGLGICTNKPERLALKLLEKLGVRDCFGSVIGADTLPVSKPHPAPLMAAVEQVGGDKERAVLVGDCVTDRDTARAAKVPWILMTVSPLGRDAASLDADAQVDGFSDLKPAVDRLIG